jgi:hypothetical protein
MNSKFLRQVFAVLALSGGLATAADAGIIITLTDNGDDTIAFSMSGDFTVYASGSSANQGSFGSYFGADNGTISNASTSDAVTQFDFNYVDAGGDASAAIAAAFGPGLYAASAYSGSGHVFQNFTNANIKVDQALTTSLTIGDAITGSVISGISASGTYVGSFASAGITAGTAVTRYGADSFNYDTLTINTVAAVPEPSTALLLGLGFAGLSMRRRVL